MFIKIKISADATVEVVEQQLQLLSAVEVLALLIPAFLGLFLIHFVVHMTHRVVDPDVQVQQLFHFIGHKVHVIHNQAAPLLLSQTLKIFEKTDFAFRVGFFFAFEKRPGIKYEFVVVHELLEEIGEPGVAGSSCESEPVVGGSNIGDVIQNDFEIGQDGKLFQIEFADVEAVVLPEVLIDQNDLQINSRSLLEAEDNLVVFHIDIEGQ